MADVKPISFPKMVRVHTDERGPMFTEIMDAETGAKLDYIESLTVEVSMNETRIELRITPTKFLFRGDAKYILDEEALRRLAADNGFDIIAQ